MPEAMVPFHLLRDIGSSLFISIRVAEIVKATGTNDSRTTEMTSPCHRALLLSW